MRIFAHNKKRLKGFSLIELLAVIAIISMLSSIAVINVSSRAGLAKDAAVKNNLSILRGAIGRYYIENGRFPPSISAMEGAQLKNAYLKWGAANASGDIGYDAANGLVFLRGKNGSPPAGTDIKGVSYEKY